MNFLKEQGYVISKNELMQDNQSAIRLEKNGRNSCTGNLRHIDIRYFFVKDRVDKGEIFITYCPTEVMLADFFTKPLQGRLFKFFRDIIMGRLKIELLDPKLFNRVAKQIKERVGNNDIINKMNCEKNTKERIMDKNKRKQVICYGNANTIGNYAEAHVRTRK